MADSRGIGLIGLFDVLKYSFGQGLFKIKHTSVVFWLHHKKGLRDESRNPLIFMVGVIEFEPTTPCSQIVSLLFFGFFVSV